MAAQFPAAVPQFDQRYPENAGTTIAAELHTVPAAASFFLLQAPHPDRPLTIKRHETSVALERASSVDAVIPGRYHCDRRGLVTVHADEVGEVLTCGYVGIGTPARADILNDIQAEITAIAGHIIARPRQPYLAVDIPLGDANLVTEAGKRVGYIRLPAPEAGTAWLIDQVTLWSQTQLQFAAPTGSTTVQLADAADFSGDVLNVALAAGGAEVTQKNLGALPANTTGFWYARFTQAGGHAALHMQVLFTVENESE